MNLQNIAAGIVSAVNPQQPASVYLSTGPGPTQPDGSRTPTYDHPFTVSAQIQPLGTGDLRKLDALNIQGSNEKIYINGELRGIERVNRLGGDLVVLKTGETYLIKAVLEGWTNVGWCCVAVVLQDDAKVGPVRRPRF